MKTQKEMIRQITKEYNKELTNHFQTGIVRNQLIKLQTVSRNYHLEINESVYLEKIKKMCESYAGAISRGLGLEQEEYLDLLFGRCVIPSLLIPEKEKVLHDLGRPLPAWTADNLSFAYDLTMGKLEIAFDPGSDFGQLVWDQYCKQEDFSKLVSPRVIKECNFKKMFYPEEAKSFLVQQTVNSVNQAAELLNENLKLNPMMEEMREALKPFYWMNC